MFLGWLVVELHVYVRFWGGVRWVGARTGYMHMNIPELACYVRSRTFRYLNWRVNRCTRTCSHLSYRVMGLHALARTWGGVWWAYTYLGRRVVGVHVHVGVSHLAHNVSQFAHWRSKGSVAECFYCQIPHLLVGEKFLWIFIGLLKILYFKISCWHCYTFHWKKKLCHNIIKL